MNFFVWILGAYLCGGIPFSVWLGRLLLGKEIRDYGDGNPGGANVIRAGGKWLGVAVILFDGLKGALPVLLAQRLGQSGDWPLAAIALAAVSGHAFSIFLGFRGGKAVAVTFGIWAGLNGWPILFLLGAILLVAYYLTSVDGWAVMFALCGLLVYLVAIGSAPQVVAVWLGNSLILAWKHRLDLSQRPGFRPLSR